MNNNIIRTALRNIYTLYKQFKLREKSYSYGEENKDKIFYVIGADDRVGGLWWLINKAVMHIGYAIDHGYIPVVDYMNFYTQYTSSAAFGKENIWELFFKQPCGYSLDDIKNSKHVIINKQAPAPNDNYLMGQEQFYDNPQRIQYFKSILNTFVHFNETTEALLNEKFEQIVGRNKRVVGVLCRGTDYVLKKPKGHPVQPTAELVINDVKDIMIKFNCEYVFLATEDQDIFEAFKTSFHDQLKYVDQVRYSKKNMNTNDYLSQIVKNKDNQTDNYGRGLEYLTATYILSKCTCFVGGRTGGTKGVLLLPSNFEYCKVYDLGMY